MSACAGLVLAGLALAGQVAAAEQNGAPELSDPTQRISYSLGYQIGGDFKRQGVQMDAAAVVRGIQDALAGGEPAMRPDEMHATLVELKKKVEADQHARSRATELAVLEEGKQFLEANAHKNSVVTTASGLQYRILAPGSGPKPGASDRVTVNYHGRLIDGREFDTGKSKSFALNGVIKGWTEGLQLIGAGGHIELFVPAELAYRDRGPLGNRTLIFDIELLSVAPPPQ